MERFLIRGGKPLFGEIEISGAKNAVVGILPATILTGSRCIIDNVPMIKDVISMVDILREMGAEVRCLSPHKWEIDTRCIRTHVVGGDLTSKLRASYYLIGALLGRFGVCDVSMPGGCVFGGARPINLHIKGFTALGAEFDTNGGDRIRASVPNGLKGNKIYFDKVSVGATMNVMLAAVFAEGMTVLENAAREPHIVDLANFLNRCGAEIRGAGTNTIQIFGVSELHGCEYSIIPDQIEAGTYMVAAAATRGHLKINNVTPKHLESISVKLRECGVEVVVGDDYVDVDGTGDLRCCELETQPHPGFPTDMQPQMTALLMTCPGTSFVTDSIWGERFKYIDRLNLMGGKIRVVSNTAVIEGGRRLVGARVTADDLRAGAALIIAGLIAEGVTTVEGIDHIDRGYEDVVGKLTGVGADIERVTDPSGKGAGVKTA